MKKLIILSLLYSGLVSANNCEKLPDDYICVIAGGSANTDIAMNAAHARSMALRTARILAYEKMVEKLKGVIIGSKNVIKNDSLNDSTVTTIINSTLKNFKIEKESLSYLKDGSPWAEVTISVPVQGDDGIRTKVLEYKNGIESEKISDTEFNKEEDVVIDASQTSYKRQLFPKILSTSGKVLSDGLKVSFTNVKSDSKSLLPQSVDDEGNLIVDDYTINLMNDSKGKSIKVITRE